MESSESNQPLPPEGTAPAPPTPESPIRLVFFNDRELRAGWRLLIYLLLAAIVNILVALLARGRQPSAITVLSPRFVFFSHGTLLLGVLIPALVMAFFERRTLGHYGLPVRLQEALGKNFWLGMLWGVVALTLLLLILRINGSFLFGGVGITAATAFRYALLWAIAFFLVAVAEEFMFRGYIYYTLTSGLSFLGGKSALIVPAALTSILFALAHVGNPNEMLLGLGAVVAIGLFLAFTLLRTGSLWFAIGFHASWDWAQTYLYGVPNSGIPARGHLLNPTIQGPHWYSGGSVGPEGSILMYPLLALLFVLFHRSFPKGIRYPAPDSVPPPTQEVALG